MNSTNVNPSNQIDDELIDLFERCKRNDSRAQYGLYKKFAPKLYALALRYVVGEDEAQDVLQEAFLTVFLKIKELQNVHALPSWIRKIVVNECLQRLRKTDALRMSKDVYLEEGDEVIGVASIEWELGYNDLLSLIHQLPVQRRAVFCMFALDGYPHAEIAKTLGISDGASRAHYSKAKEDLQRMHKELNSSIEGK